MHSATRTGHRLRSRQLLLFAALALLFAIGPSATAGAAPVYKCSGKTVYLIDQESSVVVQQLDIKGVPRLTNGYAPRCLVADALASLVQSRFAERGTLPRRVKVGGARWFAGTWQVRSTHLIDDRDAQPYESVVARRGKGRITFILYDTEAEPEYPAIEFTRVEPILGPVANEDCDDTSAQAVNNPQCWPDGVTGHNAVIDVADRETAQLVALGVTAKQYERPWSAIEGLKSLGLTLDVFAETTREAIIRFPGGELRVQWPGIGGP